MKQVPLAEALNSLPALLDAAVGGEEIFIARDPQHVVRLVPVILPSATEEKKPRRQPGSMKGLIKMSDDFDDPLPEFEPYTG